MNPALRSLLMLLLLGSVGVGCRGDVDAGDPDVQVRPGFSPTPPIVGPTRIVIALHDGDTPVQGARMRLEGSMDHAGMVPVQDTTRDLGDGNYVAPEFNFDMAGEWTLEVAADLPDGRRVVRRFPVRVTDGRPSTP